MSSELELNKSYNGELMIEGFVDIHNGDYHQLGKRNHFTTPMLYHLINWLAWTSTTSINSLLYTWQTSPFTNSYMVLGTDTTTRTLVSFTALVSPIGTPPGTKANSQTGASSGLVNGAAVTYTATWSSGTVSGTCGEVGLYLYTGNSLKAFGGGVGTGTYFCSRLSNGDGDFASFAINTAQPLTINWTIQFTFA